MARPRRAPRHGVAMMGVDLDGTILLLAPAAEPANLRLPRTACVIGLVGEVVIDGTKSQG
jgi:hypothetical protein